MANAVQPGKDLLPTPLRCSRTQPCDSCLKSNSECVFPGPGRAPRRKKRPLKAELISRLKGLEQELREMTQKRGDPDSTTKNEHGKLIVEGHSTRYVTHEVLVSLGNQIEELKDLVDSTGNNIEEDGGDEYSQNGNQFLFGYSSIVSSLSAFHPSLRDSQILWKTFEENVAPVVMIFHKPTLHRLIYKTATNTSYIDRSSETVVFAVYFAAVTSMSPEQCAEELGQDHSTLLQQYRFATQQALARAGFLQTRSQTVLQAAVLFLTCLRRPGDAEFVWTMTAAVYRLAQGLGLHRDGTHFSLTPFEIELRRRLWWSIYLLDSQSSELHVIGTLITKSCYDTKLLLNINDTGLSPESTTPPEERNEFTEMTFCLIRCEMTVRYRRSFLNAHPAPSSREGHTAHLVDERLRQLEQIRTHLQDRYLQYCDISIPAQWVTATVIRLALARSWLVAHLSQGTMTVQMPLIEISPDDPKRDQLFLTALEVVEFAYLLETDLRTTRWAWLFERYPQWHAVVFVLTGLCGREQSVETERAWAVLQKAIERWTGREFQKGGITLRMVYHFMEKVAVAHGRLGTDWIRELLNFET
ncbi:fungal-specific transcription factor domain-containing protein [Aspergillus caelatus]|uniref:Fungal-specific transcription factor domain-containing protein n=1 Tax=Aspergillus caelatus TaxID=61420 RepID=A0A5N7A5C9_9EURO|nr:fungal-specific transcription factor domain-containing protein [Aspergillus caelatus]KAE8363720.1 fungal-specific transcription factor domain-containing protein [Aspergillus caelatus]